MKATEIEIEKLVPYAKNSRVHSDNQVAQIAASIKEFGFNDPIEIDEDNMILAGHGRVLAARKLGMLKVPCVKIEGLSKAQKQAYILTNNKLALNSEWDDELLKLELHDLSDMKFDMEMMGFDGSELSEIMYPEPIKHKDDSDKPLNFSIQYNIVFDDEEQQEVFYAFIRFLKEKFPETDSVCERLAEYIKELDLG
jgi:hypothetical protein